MPKWIRVRDTQTGHQFDIDARVLPHRRGVEPVNDPERWPDVEGPRAVPRPPKPHVGKDGKARAAAGPDGEPSTSEQTSGRRRTNPTAPGAPADSSKENEE